MRKLRTVATTLATSCCIIYLLLQLDEVTSLFPATFILLLKQALVITLFATIAINPHGVVSAAARLAPKVLEIASMFVSIFTSGKKKDDTE